MSKPYEYSLIIGRFQPLCMNHVELIQKAESISDKVIIGIGTANLDKFIEIMEKNYYFVYIENKESDISNYNNKYIFDFETVHDFIIRSEHLRVPYAIFNIPDIFDKERYEEHVKYTINKDIYLKNKKIVLIGENEETLGCFKTMDKLIPVLENNFHASDVRKEIKETGYSNRLGCDLATDEVKKIIF